MSPGEAHLHEETRKVAPTRAVIAAGTHATLVWLCWANRSAALALACIAVAYALAGWMLGARVGRGASTPTFIVRALVNVAAVVSSGLLSGWAPPTWILLMFVALLRDDLNVRRSRLIFFAALSLVTVVALTTAPDRRIVLSFCLLALVVHQTGERRTQFTCKLLNELGARNQELVAAHAQLQVLHATALEQEKLSSLGMLAAGVAHEINNPMSYVAANVRTMLDELRARPTLDAELRDYVDDLLPATLDGIRRVNGIVADLRGFARGDCDEMGAVDLNEQVRSALRIAGSSANGTSDVEVALGEIPTTHGRAQQLVQVVMNLFINAAEARRPGTRGHIRVITRLEDGAIALRVADDGTGIPAEVRAHLFEPFRTTKPAGKGTGLGLVIVKRIVDAHGGKIDVQSEPGRGTTFTVWLPASAPERTRVEAEAREDEKQFAPQAA